MREREALVAKLEITRGQVLDLGAAMDVAYGETGADVWASIAER
jgi:hypothetical protein